MNEIARLAQLKKITTFVFDVDGVFTDCLLTVGDSDVQRIYNVRDGYAIQMAIKSGYRIAIISGGKQESIRKRLTGLGIPEVFLSVATDQKPAKFQQFIHSHAISEDEVLFMGDDIPDLLVMNAFDVFKACPSDAVQEVLDACDYISAKKGGDGAVRDAIELVMKAQGTWMKVF
ncbi:MAG: KdsC family phosphatase [Leadbetterella sp.]